VLAIEAESLTKVYADGKVPVLTALRLQVPPGSSFGLIGPNGAGKTTFIKLLLGVVKPSSGSVRVLGKSPDDLGVRRRIGYLPERLHLPDAWRPLDFLKSIARLKQIDDGDHHLRAQLARVGLAEETKRKMGGFSKGMKQRVGLAAALLGSPELLILDEPTDGIDPLGRAEVRRILMEERGRGATILLNSHLLSETERICDRIAILAGGRVLKEGAVDALCGDGRNWRVRFNGRVDSAQLKSIGFDPGDNDGVYRCSAETVEELNARLATARAQGLLIIELRRELRELEDVLADAVKDVA
jgi:ABC-2 type transport system ATP-binding protein